MYPVNYNPFRFVSESGDRYAPVLVGEVQDNGKITLFHTGEVRDLWKMHSAQAEQCDINNIVMRFQNGDLTVLQRTQGNYLDLTNMPHNLREAYELSNNIQDFYSNMPDEFRNRFSGFDDFLSSAGSEQWFEKLRVKEEVKLDNGQE